MTLGQQYALLTTALAPRYGQAEAAAIARRVLTYRLGLSDGQQVFLRAADKLSEGSTAALADDERRLLRGEPVQYVLGTAPFLDLELEVAPGVLIPRPETEELVQLLVEENRHRPGPLRVLDVGTGSGCIAVAVAHYLPRAEVAGLDVSAEALSVAQRNGARYGDAVQWLLADLFADASDLLGPATLDILVSNPPYIPRGEEPLLAEHVRAYEPALALFVPDDDPLRYYRRLAAVGRHWLRPGGRLYLETHTNYAAAVRALLQATGYAQARVREDFTGRPRFVLAERV